MILLAYSVDVSFMVGGSCPLKAFLVPDPLVEPVVGMILVGHRRTGQFIFL